MTTAVDHIYQGSDLAGSRRKGIVEVVQRSATLLRAPNGNALASLPHVELERSASVRDYARGFVMLESALRHLRNGRHAADFGAQTFVFSLSEEQLLEFRDDVSDTLMRVCSGVGTVRSLLDTWRATAEFMTNETAVTALREDLESSTEVQCPKDTEA